MATKERPKSEASKLYEASASQLTKIITSVGLLVIIIGVVIFGVTLFRKASIVITETRQAEVIVRATEAERRTQAAAIAIKQKQAAEEVFSRRWVLYDATLNNTVTDIYVSDYSINKDLALESISFEYSFYGNGEWRSNSWVCRATRTDQFDCTWTQEYEGGRLHDSASLTRKSPDLFSGRYKYQNRWYETYFASSEKELIGIR